MLFIGPSTGLVEGVISKFIAGGWAWSSSKSSDDSERGETCVEGGFERIPPALKLGGRANPPVNAAEGARDPPVFPLDVAEVGAAKLTLPP
jgi:hypothetical protein